MWHPNREWFNAMVRAWPDSDAWYQFDGEGVYHGNRQAPVAFFPVLGFDADTIAVLVVFAWPMLLAPILFM